MRVRGSVKDHDIHSLLGYFGEEAGRLVHAVFTDVDVPGIEALGLSLAVGVEVHDHTLASHLLQRVCLILRVPEQLQTRTNTG